MTLSIQNQAVQAKQTLDVASVTILESDAKKLASMLGAKYITKYTPKLDKDNKPVLNDDGTPKTTYNGMKRRPMSEAIGTFLHVIVENFESVKADADGKRVITLEYTPTPTQAPKK